jgi:hypothetical protein
MNADAMTIAISTTAPDTVSLLGVKFGYIEEFIELMGGRDILAGMTTTEVKDLMLPVTAASQLSLCEQLSKEGRVDVVGRASWFISHAWKYKFLDVMEAVGIFLEGEYGEDAMIDVVIWFDLFSNSQYGCVDRPYEWWKTTFLNAVKELGNVLMIMEPYDDPITLTRAWCVFEVYACIHTKSRF